MRIKRYEAIVSALRKNCQFPSTITEFAIYRRSDDNWLDESGIPVNDKHLLQELKKTLWSRKRWRAQKSCRTFFPILEFDAVLLGVSTAPPREPTLKVCDKNLFECIKHANDAYYASHDALTGVLNAKSIESRLLDSLDRASTSAGSKSQAATTVSVPSRVAVISLDLDHFKQVNDSYGHDYGDIVLTCFANRIENKVCDLQSEYAGTSFAFGRSGGEEFLLVLGGSLEEEAVLQIAEEIRLSVSKDLLPTKREWMEITAARDLQGLDLPQDEERRITASVGVSSIVTPQPRKDSRSLCGILKREADTAMYRAKAGGRNVVRYFRSIRNNHGTVLEHHKDTDVVVIDIGSNVGVQSGHEFVVYHPDFTGKKQFIYSDGRSRKQLGNYPRHASGRIVVFEAQQEISFCKVEHNGELTKFPIGCELEFIPMGSIVHLIGLGGGQYALDSIRLKDPVALQKEVESHAENRIPTVVFVFNLLNPTELESSRGTAFTNRTLASFYGEIDRTFPPPASMSQIAPTMLAVVDTSPQRRKLVDVAEALVQKYNSQYAGLARFGVGYHAPRLSNPQKDKSKIDPKFALEYARYAASPDVLIDDHIIEAFSPNTAFMLIARLRELGRFDEAKSVYTRLTEIGLNEGHFHNQGALVLFEDVEPDFQTALVAIRRACDLEPNEPWWVANRAVILFANGKRLEAYKDFSQVAQMDSSLELVGLYKSCRAVAAYEQFRVDPSQVSGKVVLAWLREAKRERATLRNVISAQDIEDASKATLEALEGLDETNDSSLSQ